MATALQNIHSNLFQDALKNGLQSYVNTTGTLTATTTAGTPVAGTFVSSIPNRAPITDISKDLKVSFGIERIATQQIVQLQNEFGPNGEPVWAAVNDDRGLIRFVGAWVNVIANSGQFPNTANVGDYIEITFFGTGLSLLSQYDSTATRDWRVSVDGAAEGSNFYVAGSSVIQGRNYSNNTIVNITSGLSLGVHTVRIRSVVGALFAYGFEILNTASTTSLNVNPGIAYIDGLKTSLSAAQSVSYNSGFETGTLGTRGGHVVAYLKLDGTIGKAVTPVNAASAFLTSADHTNEEIQRTYNFREFGAGRTDDFSLLAGTGSNRSFTLDDGTTTLVALNYLVQSNGYGDSLVAASGAGDFLTFTFVGTGLDIVNNRGLTATCSYTISVDGVNVLTSTLFGGSGSNNTIKICSGLPYGTHTVKFLFVSGVSNSAAISNFKVYQPKKPSIPTGAIELADYNVMAAYIANTNPNLGYLVSSSGILYKSSAREITYVGTWSITQASSIDGGWYTSTTSAGSFYTYTFYGTGIELYLGGSSGVSATITVDGSTPATAILVGTGASYSVGTVTSTGMNTGLQITGLALGLHTVKVISNNANNFQNYGQAVITPIYSAKSNVNADSQNTLPVGSNSLSDNRQVSLIKATDKPRKNWVQAVGVSSNPSTTSNSLVPCPDMSVVLNTNGGRVLINYSITLYESTIANYGVLQIYIDGLPVGIIKIFEAQNTGQGYSTVSDSWIAQLSPGAHKIDVYWAAGSGTAVGWTTSRTMNAAEF